MAVVQVRKSDYSGADIPEGTGGRVRVMFDDPEKNDLRADLTDAEIKKLLPFMAEVEPRPQRRGEKRMRI